MYVGSVKDGLKLNLNGFLVIIKFVLLFFLEISGEKKCGPTFIHFDFADFNGQYLGPRDKF